MVLEVNLLLNYPDFVGVIVKNAVDLYHVIEKWKSTLRAGESRRMEGSMLKMERKRQRKWKNEEYKVEDL